MNNEFFIPPTELVAYLRWNSVRNKALSASVGITLRDMYAEAADEIERLRTTIKELHHHLGEALYSDEWNTREYAIAAHSRHEKELGNG
jgi:hypothetical protein